MNWSRSLNGSLANCLLILTTACTPFSQSPLAEQSSRAASPQPTIGYKTYVLPRSLVHVLTIPVSRYPVLPMVADTLESVEAFAQRTDAIAVINGGFFDPQNTKSTSYVVVNGQQVADPRQNQRLIENPDLAPYMDKILNRSELRQYQCGPKTTYDIVLHQSPVPPGCELTQALGAGPQLLPESTAVTEGFIDNANGVVIRDALGSQQPNARSAVGLTGDGTMVWVVATQPPEHPTGSGLTLSELTEFLRSLAVERAMNLDGGSSTSLYYQGRTVYGKLDSAGATVKRQIKSVLLVPNPATAR
ncbi:phosphodiester glycosidase family protein [Pantanalinema rosaneae CENA516]|uniref:phosphodiester glycosidase family protein n=1 Tax=Pantanalinema rosaneae TaxID=1620701 RepID=UPI003D6FEE53